MLLKFFAAIGIYHSCVGVYKFTKRLTHSLTRSIEEKVKKIESEQKQKEIITELKRREKLVLDMYQEGYSRRQIKIVYGDLLKDETIDKICDAEDSSWSAKA